MVSFEIVRCRIPELLVRIGKSSAWLADVTGLGKPRISDYSKMRDGIVMSMRVAKLISFYLKCKVDDLYEWREVG